MIVVIDGPAGSGKSSTAKAIAEQLQIQFLDSGALYRVATLVYLESLDNGTSFFDRLKESDISFYFKNKNFHSFLNGEEVSDEIREMKVSNAVSKVASDPMVRSHINKLMRAEVETGVYIADGRDLGTAVFPDAELKFFMVADLHERAKRRLAEMEAQGLDASLEEIKSNLESRDNADSSRASDPLKQADDAILINTSELSFEEQVSQIAERVRQIMPPNKQ
ncbi:MAG: (d)CMP kinase [Balneola sp.]|nr:(d)CMP kinase [Balneola sp.]MBO6652024.1 (d)CMP kinase [Balneola sp.]MBO6711914.1 (d)CMP kinase [Balneola sp.]MBO6800109.1 (d)CMP kinase [Balneola sp.]MBO6871510.1 (d)CMP kinase [Balneola sp.]